MSRTLDERVAASTAGLSPAEARVAQFFRDNRAEVMVASASALAAKIGTSDATVVRTAQALGYDGLDQLRRDLAQALRENLAPAARLARTLDTVGDDPDSALATTLDVHARALAALRRDVTPALFHQAVDRLAGARRVVAFGIGPSSAIADYFAIQLARFGLEAAALRQTGLLLADELHRLRRGDVVVILAYGRVYRELAVVLDRAHALGLARILITDTLGDALRGRVDLVLPVPRGRADQLSMHATTLALIEALLVGIAARRPDSTVASLKALNDLRAQLAGDDVELPVSGTRQRRRRR
jgi:DNA-binding MurR/RpiR family transcriptional regulator